MTLQIRPTEIKAVANLLMQEHDDVDTLARQVIELIDGIRAKRELYVLTEIHPTLKVARTIGPYATEKQALKDTILLSKYDDTSRAYLCKFVDPAIIQARET